MNIREGIKRTTWCISVLSSIIVFVWYWVMVSRGERAGYHNAVFTALIPFSVTWLLHFSLVWIMKGFKDSKKD